MCVWGGGGGRGTGNKVKRFNSIFVSSFIIQLFKLDGRFTSLLPFSVILEGGG